MNPRQTLLPAVALLVAATAIPIQAQTPPIIKQTFEESDGGWTLMGTGGRTSVTQDAANVKSGKAALQLDYSIKKGDVCALLLLTPDGLLAKAKSIRFAVKSDSGAVLGAILQEQGAGRYIAMFTVPAGKWQQVELSPADFVLSDDVNDPPDPDNKLDMDKVEAFGLTDVGQVMAQADNPELERLLNVKRGDHVLYLDDLIVTEDPLASPAISGDILDSFSRPQIGWFTIGDVKVAQLSGAPLTGRGIQLDYKQVMGKPVAVIRRIPRGTVTGKATFSVDVASTRPAKLLLQVEEKGGGKYNILVDVAGGKQLKTLSFPFTEFKEADDSKDSNGKLDLDQVNQVLIIDVDALLGMPEADNTLWIGNVKASK
jgi:hypothetical protein